MHMRFDLKAAMMVLVLAGALTQFFAHDTRAFAQEAAEASPEEAFREGIVAYNRGDVSAAIGHFSAASEAGHSGAQVRLGFIHDISGAGAEAERWYRASAEQGNPDGKFYLARLLASDDLGAPKPDQALALFRELSQSGYGQASVVLANSYETGGLGLEPAEHLALQTWMTAAAQGEAEAALRLHRAYSNGELGVEADPEEAQNWLALSKQLGNAEQQAVGTPDPPAPPESSREGAVEHDSGHGAFARGLERGGARGRCRFLQRQGDLRAALRGLSRQPGPWPVGRYAGFHSRRWPAEVRSGLVRNNRQ